MNLGHLAAMTSALFFFGCSASPESHSSEIQGSARVNELESASMTQYGVYGKGRPALCGDVKDAKRHRAWDDWYGHLCVINSLGEDRGGQRFAEPNDINSCAVKSTRIAHNVYGFLQSFEVVGCGTTSVGPWRVVLAEPTNILDVRSTGTLVYSVQDAQNREVAKIRVEGLRTHNVVQTFLVGETQFASISNRGSLSLETEVTEVQGATRPFERKVLLVLAQTVKFALYVDRDED